MVRTMATHEIRIDRSLPLAAEPHTGHNRWHPDIPPILRCEPGDEVRARDPRHVRRRLRPAVRLQVGRGGRLRAGPPAHRPGARGRGGAGGPAGGRDPRGDSRVRSGSPPTSPGSGSCRQDFPDPHLVKWELADGWATSDDLPGVRIAGAPFMGVVGVAPSRALLEAAAGPRGRSGGPEPRRPGAPGRAGRGGASRPGHRRRGAADGPAPGERRQRRHQAADGRDPPAAPGVGRGSVVLRRRRPLRPGRRRVVRHGHRDGRHAPGAARPPQGPGGASGESRRSATSATSPAAGLAPPGRYFATTGMCIERDGRNQFEDITLAARNALDAMIRHLTAEYGYTPPAGLHDLQRRRGPQDQPGRRRPQRDRLGLPAARHLRLMGEAGEPPRSGPERAVAADSAPFRVFGRQVPLRRAGPRTCRIGAVWELVGVFGDMRSSSR